MIEELSALWITVENGIKILIADFNIEPENNIFLLDFKNYFKLLIIIIISKIKSPLS